MMWNVDINCDWRSWLFGVTWGPKPFSHAYVRLGPLCLGMWRSPVIRLP